MDLRCYTMPWIGTNRPESAFKNAYLSFPIPIFTYQL
jgi:hypothetical protein